MRRSFVVLTVSLALSAFVGCGGDEDDDAGLFGGTAGSGASSGEGAGASTSAGRGGSKTTDPSGKGGTGGSGDTGGGNAKGGNNGGGSSSGAGGGTGGQPAGGNAGAGAAAGSEGVAGTGSVAGKGGDSGEGGSGENGGQAGNGEGGSGEGGSGDPGGAGGTAAAGAAGSTAGGSSAGGNGTGGGPAVCSNTLSNGSMGTAVDVGTIADNACERLFSEKQLLGPGDEDWFRYTGTDTLGAGCSTEPFAELVSGEAGEVCVFLQPTTPASGGIACLSGTASSSGGISGCCSKSLARLQFGRYLGIDDATVWVVVRGATSTCAPYRVELGYGGLVPADATRPSTKRSAPRMTKNAARRRQEEIVAGRGRRRLRCLDAATLGPSGAGGRVGKAKLGIEIEIEIARSLPRRTAQARRSDAVPPLTAG